MDAVISPQLYFEGSIDSYPLLMARPSHHVIDITPNSQPSTSESFHNNNVNVNVHVNNVNVNVNVNNDNEYYARLRREDSRRHRNPLNSGFWICFELFITLTPIAASVVVLCLSKNEHPKAPLFTWIVGYASGCVASLPLPFWHYYRSNCVAEQHSPRGSNRIHDPSGTLLPSGEGDGAPVAANASFGNSWLMNERLKTLVEYYEISLDLFFAIWFVLGNVWIFGGHSSANDAPNLYRLCVVFLTFSCIGYAMPFILCATICCCLPCIISILGAREDLVQTRGATDETIDALPTYKFIMKKNKSSDESSSPVSEGGIVAAGTEKERMISGEDAVCCICLAKYENNDDLRELPCSHLFHKDCVDKWLKINALCPLCKSEVGENVTEPNSEEDATQQQGERRVENGLTNNTSS